MTNALESLLTAGRRFLGENDPNETSLSAAVPLLLVPVRLETRFVTADSVEQAPIDLAVVRPRVGGELLVRVYPDTISTSSFEPELTADELAAGTAYWQATWAAGEPVAEAWRTLAARFGAPRAAWVAHALTPRNVGTTDTEPDLPTPTTRASSYEKAPTAQCLPDHWIVVLEHAGATRTVQGGPIQSDLAVGFTPHDGALPDGLTVDAGMRWLVDFGTAEQAGMAVRIPLSSDEQQTGFDRVLVFGVRDSTAVGSGQDELRALLDAHHYTDGLALVPQGSPTNNTVDAASAFSTADPDQTISFGVEQGDDLAADPARDGATLAQALGLEAETFSHVRNADGTGTSSSADMLTALWPATVGYFLDQMMSPQLTADQQDAIRQFALATVRPRGPVPALRVGATPYGVLPTTSLTAVPAAARNLGPAGNTHARGLLAQLDRLLLPAWQASIAGVPQIGASGDPDADLARVLGMDASSLDYRGRRVIGDDLLWNMLTFLNPSDPPSQESWAEHLARGRALLDSFGLTSWDPRVIHTAMGRDSYPVPYPSVQSAPLSETDPVAPDATLDGAPVNYLQWLAHAPMTDVWDESYPGPKPTSILYRILRQSMLRDYVTIAGRAQVQSGILESAALREVELVNVRPEEPTVTARQIVDRPVAAGVAQTWAQYLDMTPATPQSPLARLADLRAAMDRLATLPSAELDRLLGETLDAASHRLDVWVTAVSTSLLTEQRSTTSEQGAPTIHLGAYGWVENLRPADPRPVVTGQDAAGVTRLDEVRQKQLGRNVELAPVRLPHEDSGGFVHAPSMTQAAAGAVLRSGYLSHRGTTAEQALTVDLSSARVSDALWLLAGVRQGLSLGALTGFQFEQQLHEASLDVYVQPFRDLYPLVSDELTGTTADGAVRPIEQVVDGVKLRAAWQSGALALGGSWGSGLPVAGDPAQAAIVAMLVRIDDMLSALGDVSIAESVFQLMRGNYGRAGGILDAISRGDHPPDPDVVATPRPGLDVTHRLMLLLAGQPQTAPAWSAVTVRPRQLAEPWLSAWVSTRLPDPTNVQARVTWTVPGHADTTRLVTLRDLDIGPLDVLAVADAGDQPQRGELESRILLAAAPPATADSVTLTYAAPHLPPDSVTFPELLTAASALRSLLGASRPLDLTTFALPDKAPTTGAVDLDELAGRVADVVTALDSDTTALQDAVTALGADPTSVDSADAVVAALVVVSAYALPGALPAPGTSATGLLEVGARALDQLHERRAAVTGSSASLADVTADAQAVLGAAVLVLAHLTPPDDAALRSAFAQSAAMQAVDPQSVRRWLLQLSHVRPGAQRLDLAVATTRLLGAERPAIELAQLPPTPGDRWLGLPMEPGTTPAGGRVAIEAVTAGDPATAATYAGLLVDEWVERIPADAVTAGVAFHYDEPNARAPQAMLLAVSPDDRETWDLELVAAILDETFELAKIRGVDLSSVTEVGQILPALYFPFNLESATPATTFAKEVTLDDSVVARFR